MALIAPDICRYTIVGTLAGQDCQNILDVRLVEPGILSREDVISEVAGDLLNQWVDHILPLVCDDYTFTSVRWVDLDTPDGSTGSRTSTDGTTLPAQGELVFDPLPNNVYAKITKNLEGKNRIQRNGTLRLGGLAEGWTDPAAPNTVATARRTEIQDAFEALKDGINEGVGGWSTNLVVVHTVDQEYSGYSEIANFTCAPVVGTIRRRMPGYGS